MSGPHEFTVSPPHALRVAILDDYQDVALSLADWSSLAPSAKVRAFRDHVSDEAALVERLVDFDVIVAMRERTPFPRSLLHRLPKLRLLVTTGMRNAAIDVAAANERGIVVSGTDGLPYPTSEMTWALILALARNVPAEDRATRNGAWQTSLGIGLSGKTLGVLGLGRLGTQVAKVGRAFGMNVIAWSPNLTPERAVAGGAEFVDQAALLTRADVLTVHLVLSERTRGLIDADELAQLKRSALLVNTSRGPIVDESALVSALERRLIAGAALDVFDREPLPSDHPLLHAPNTVLTPHLGYVTRETYEIFYSQAVIDIRGFASGTPVRVLPPS
ncbi:MAG TPA: D-2-hydroxyacid dehydrogenase family protein [Polyangiales bacterium]